MISVYSIPKCSLRLFERLRDSNNLLSDVKVQSQQFDAGHETNKNSVDLNFTPIKITQINLVYHLQKDIFRELLEQTWQQPCNYKPWQFGM